jgi:ribose transport system substrate-binding protein
LGFLKSIEEYKLNPVASEPADWETDKAEAVFSQLFSDFPDIEGVFAATMPWR